MHYRSLNWILEQKEDINGKTSEKQIKSGAYLIIMCQCQFLSFDKCTMVIYNGENEWGVYGNSL